MYPGWRRRLRLSLRKEISVEGFFRLLYIVIYSVNVVIERSSYNYNVYVVCIALDNTFEYNVLSVKYSRGDERVKATLLVSAIRMFLIRGNSE